MKRTLMIVAILGLILSWGLIGLAQDKPDRPDRPDRPERPDRPDRPDKPQPGDKQRQGMRPMLMSPAIKEEMQRHREVMKGLFEQIKALHEKIREEIGSKMKELREEIKGRQDRPDRPEKPDRPARDNNSERPERPDRPDRPERSSESKPREKFREEIEKLLEPYRAEAEQIASAMVTEMALHHQNLAQIISSEQADITKKLAKRIFMPRRPGQHRRSDKGDSDRPDRPERPDRPDRPDKPEPAED